MAAAAGKGYRAEHDHKFRFCSKRWHGQQAARAREVTRFRPLRGEDTRSRQGSGPFFHHFEAFRYDEVHVLMHGFEKGVQERVRQVHEWKGNTCTSNGPKHRNS